MGSRSGSLERLRAADRSLKGERLRPQATRRIAARISTELRSGHAKRRLRWVPMVTFAAGAAVVLAFVAWVRTGLWAPEATDQATPIARAMAATVSGDGCTYAHDEAVDLQGACSVVTQGPAMRIETSPGARVRLDDRRLAVHEGTAVFDVDKVQGEPVVVTTAAGRIVVVGTRFAVRVQGDKTTVDLYEGRVRVVAEGRQTVLDAGQRLVFGGGTLATGIAVPVAPAGAEAEVLPAEPGDEAVAPVESPVPAPRQPALAPTTAAPRPARASPRKPTAKVADASQTESEAVDDAAALIERVKRRQRVGDYEGAVALLRAALDEVRPKRTKEVLSNELGRVLARKVGDRVRACRHWQSHLARFGGGRYEPQIEASMETLRCSEALAP